MTRIHYFGALLIPVFFFHFVTIIVGRRHAVLTGLGYLAAILCEILSFSGVLVGFWENTRYFQFYPKPLNTAYLIFLGIRALLERQSDLAIPAHFKRRGAGAAFRQGILTNILNPKVALFFLAFLPQFIDSGTPSKTFAFLVLGLTFVTTGTIWCLILAWFSSAFSDRLRENPTVTALLNRAVGSLFIFLGLRLAVAARR